MTLPKLGYFCTKIGSGKTPLGGSEVYVPDGVTFLRSQNIHNGELRLDDVVKIAPNLDTEMAGSRVMPGDVLFNITGASIGRCCIVPATVGPANVNQHVCIIRPADHRYGAYFSYALQSPEIQGQISASLTGAARDGVTFEQLSSLRLPVPSPVEALERSQFLDRETAQIDELIAKQERLIELLAEKRQAVITHAVTKGLDPNASTKPSGIPWLGDVPKHWSLPKLKNCSRVKRGRFMHRPRNAPHLYDGEYPFIQTGAIARAEGKYVTEYSQTLSDAGLETSAMMAKGTLVMAIAANIGDVAILAFDSCAPDSVLGFQPTKQTSADFLYYALIAKREELTSEAPVTSQGNLNVERVGGVTVPLPPFDEQAQIVTMLDEKLTHMAHIVTKASIVIAMLRERRAALISAAVTGNIDVSTQGVSA